MDSYHDIKKKWNAVIKDESMAPPLAVAFNDICYLIDLLEASDKKLLCTNKYLADMKACFEKLERALL